MENDFGAFFNKNDDKYFTHGTKFSAYRDLRNEYPEREIYSFGQNIYTPSKKRAEASPSDLRNNRPYSGWLYLEYRNAEIKDRTKTIWGVQAGCSGRCSYAKETQIGVHKFLGQGYPTWNKDYALKSEPGLILEGEKYYALTEEFNPNFVSNYFIRSKLGNIITSFSSGFNFFYGRGISEFYPEPITFKNAKRKSYWSYYFFGDVEGRLVPYNHFLEGSLFQDERHTVDSNLFVGEANLGARVGYKNLKFSYNYTVFSEEWDEQGGAFFFGGLDFSW